MYNKLVDNYITTMSKYVVIASSNKSKEEQKSLLSKNDSCILNLEEAASYRLKEGEKFFFSWRMDRENIYPFINEKSDPELIWAVMENFEVLISNCPILEKRESYASKHNKLMKLLETSL